MPRPDAFTGPGPPPDPGREASQLSPAREGDVVVTYNLAVDLSPSARVTMRKLPVQTQSRLEIPDSRTNSPYSIKSTSESISRCSTAAELYIGTKISITPRMSRSGRASGRLSNIPTPILLQTQTEEVSPTSYSRKLTSSIDVERPISSDMDSSRAFSTRLSRLPVATGNRPKTARVRGQKPPSPESTSESISRCSSAARLYIGTKIPITPRMSRSGRVSGRISNIPTPILLQTQTEEGYVSPKSYSRKLTPNDVERPISSGMDSSRASTEPFSRLPVATGNRPKTSRMRGQKPPSPDSNMKVADAKEVDEEFKIPDEGTNDTVEIPVDSNMEVAEAKEADEEFKIPDEDTEVTVIILVDSDMEGAEAKEADEEFKILDEDIEVKVEIPIDSNVEVAEAKEADEEFKITDEDTEVTVEIPVDSKVEVADVVDSKMEDADVVDSKMEDAEAKKADEEFKIQDEDNEVTFEIPSDSNVEVAEAKEADEEFKITDEDTEVTVEIPVDSKVEVADVVDSKMEDAEAKKADEEFKIQDEDNEVTFEIPGDFNIRVAEAKEADEEFKIPDEDTEVTVEVPVDIIKEAEPDVDINKTNVYDKVEQERLKYVFEEQIISTEVELRKNLRNLDEILEAMLEKRSEVDRLASEFRELYLAVDEQDVVNGVHDQGEEMDKFRSLCREAECLESKFSFFPQDYIAQAMEEQKCESKNQEISANDVKHLFERINAAEKNSADDGLNETQIASMVEKFIMGSAKHFEHESKDSFNTDAVVDRFASNECDVATKELNSSIDAIVEKYNLNEHQVNDNTDIVQQVATPTADFSIDMYEKYRDRTKHAQLLDTIEEDSVQDVDDNAEQTHNDSADSDRRGTAEEVNATCGHESQTVAKEEEETQIIKKCDRIEDVPEKNLTANDGVLDCSLIRDVCESEDEKMCDIRKSSRCHRNEIAPTTGIDRLDISGDLHEMRKELLSKYATPQEEENEIDNESDNKTNEMNLVFAWNEYSNLTDEDEVGNFLEAIQCMKRYAETGHRNVRNTIDMMIDQFVVGGDGAENQETIPTSDKIGCNITETLNIDENAVLVNGTIPESKTGVMLNVEDADEYLYDIRKLFQIEDELLEYNDFTNECLTSDLETDDVANACCQSGRSTYSIKRLFDDEFEKVKTPEEETDAVENAVSNSSRSERYFGSRADSRNADVINKELAFASSSRDVVSRCRSATIFTSIKMDVLVSKSFDSLDYKPLVLPGNIELGMPWQNLTSDVDKYDIEQTTTECHDRSSEKALNGCEKSVAISTECPDIKNVSEDALVCTDEIVVSRCKSANIIESIRMNVHVSKSFDSLDYKALVLPGNRELGMPWQNLTSEVDKCDIEQATTECHDRSGEKAMNGCEKSVAIPKERPDIKNVSEDALVCDGENAATSGIEDIDSSWNETDQDQSSMLVQQLQQRQNDEWCHEMMHGLDGKGMSMSLKQLCNNSDTAAMSEKAECDAWNTYSMNDDSHADSLANIEKAESSIPGEFHDKIEDVCFDIYGRSVDKNVTTMKRNTINTADEKTFANFQLEQDNNRIEDRKEELNHTDEPLKVVYLMHNRRKSAIPPSELKPNEDIGKYIQIEKDAVDNADREKELRHDSPLRGPEARSIFKRKDMVNTRKFEALTCPRNSDLERKPYSYSKLKHPLNGLNAKNDPLVIDFEGLRIDGTNLKEQKSSNRRKVPMKSRGTIKLITRNDLPNVRISKKHSVEVETTKRDILDVFSPMNNQQRPPARRGLNIGSYSNKGRPNALNPHQLLPSIRPGVDNPRGVNERLSNSTQDEKRQSVDCLTSPLPPIKSRHIKRYGK